MLTNDGLGPDAQDALVAGLVAREAVLDALSARERALVAYAELLTLRPFDVRASHVAALREAGCDDRTIHDACTVIGYFAFVNRIADGLGVEIEGAADQPV